MLTGLVLGVAAAALLGLTVATARRPTAGVPDVAGYLTRWAPLHGGYEPAPTSLVGRWLTRASTTPSPG